MTTGKVISRKTDLEDTQYKWGFDLDIESDVAPRGLNEDIVRLISEKKGEPKWMLEWRLKAYRLWTNSNDGEPQWANVDFPPIDYQDIIYYASPKSQGDGPKSLDDVAPEILEGFRNSSEFAISSVLKFGAKVRPPSRFWCSGGW